MVQAIAPRLGETVLDPACGTGGFLVESYAHLLERARTVEDRETLGKSVVGGEAKPLPYLLSQMNLLLHGVEYPSISTGNSLAIRIAEIGERDRVDVILTNPPFGGEEEAGIRDNFPPDRRTSETALLFLQLIMRRLRRNPRPGYGPSRAAVVVPNGTLFGDGVAARIKHELLTDFNLHTIVRLPNGVFSPYTNIPTNILFFERTGKPTEAVWYREIPLPPGRKQFTKTAPIRAEDFAASLDWWDRRAGGDSAWRVSARELLDTGCNLDLRNPKTVQQDDLLSPTQLIDRIARNEHEVLALLDEVRAIVSEAPS
jgi:type I restriction enzyme M protein